MPTFSNRFTLSHAIMAVAMFLTAMAVFELGPFGRSYPQFYSSEPTVTEYKCDTCGAFSHFTGSQIPHCRRCSTLQGE